jgi:hypothetical protein
MTESDWFQCNDPGKMLEFCYGKVSERKLRLLHCACCRRVWHALPAQASRQAVEVVESYADGLTDLTALRAAAEAASRAWSQDEDGFGAPAATATLWRLEPTYYGPVSDEEPLGMAVSVVQQLAFEGRWVFRDGLRGRDSEAAEQDERAAQAALFRCIYGNPFRSPPPLDGSVLAWNDSYVRRLAEGVYEDRQLPEGTLDLARLGVLADALEEAGCTDHGPLGHLRGPGPHVRGCWALDLILAKE